MNRSILFYVSGHGYGHARRMTQVIRSLRERNPDLKINVRSAAPSRIFEPLPADSPTDSIEHCEIDAGLVEINPLEIDRERSLRRLELFMANRDAIVAQEIAACRRIRPRLIVADIPFLAGDVAHGAAIPCMGISNFTWDWIYENLFGDDPRYAAISPHISRAYARMSILLELPFGRTCAAIGHKESMPLIAMKSSRDPADVSALLGISPDDRRPRVLFGTRGGLGAQTLANAAADAPDFLFLCPHESSGALPGNARGFSLSPALDFSDVMRVADVVVSKLGYGIVSECIATQTRLLWPGRVGFAEDNIVSAQAPSVVPMAQLPRDDYASGRWGEHLRKAMALGPPMHTMRTDGAEACAELIDQF